MFINPSDPHLTKESKMFKQELRLKCLDDRPKLRDYLERIKSHPTINQHLRERPGDDVENLSLRQGNV